MVSLSIGDMNQEQLDEYVQNRKAIPLEERKKEREKRQNRTGPINR